METVDGAQLGNEPVIGWRAWRLANYRLYGIAQNAAWQPGENRAECHAGHEHESPASACHCGFWALFNPASAMQIIDANQTTAIGLILGCGAISIHGLEGFRAGLASVACIFSDAPQPLGPDHVNPRHTVAAAYGVPCMTLEASISTGFLGEMGVGAQAIEQLKAWIAAGRPIALNKRELEIARLVARGLTTREIAASIFLAERSTEFHIYRIIKKTGSKNRADLAAWMTRYDK